MLALLALFILLNYHHMICTFRNALLGRFKHPMQFSHAFLHAIVEDVTPGIHTVVQYGHSDRGWAGPTTPDGIHTDYLLRKTT